VSAAVLGWSPLKGAQQGLIERHLYRIDRISGKEWFRMLSTFRTFGLNAYGIRIQNVILTFKEPFGTAGTVGTIVDILQNLLCSR
jgi:hypothetical protein